jgi:predicted NUDIX family NTP pyrophosphohydrolase
MNTNSKRSAGLLMYREVAKRVEVFLVHPGGPIWAKKNHGAWTIPKGEYDAGEEPLTAAQREFREETGFDPTGPFIDLGSVRQKSGKVVIAWAFAGDGDPTKVRSNTCEIEWPPRSGTRIEIQEVDKGQWYEIATAHQYVRNEQRKFLDELVKILAEPASTGGSICSSVKRSDLGKIP